MRRIVIAIAAVAAFGGGLPAKAAVTASRYTAISTYTRPQSAVHVFGFTALDAINQTQIDYGCVTVISGQSSDSGCGLLHVDMVPGALTARLTGTVTGATNVPITVNLVFATTAVETVPLPYAGAWFAPTDPPFAQAAYGSQRLGSLVGTTTSIFGTTQVSELAQATEGAFLVST